VYKQKNKLCDIQEQSIDKIKVEMVKILVLLGRREVKLKIVGNESIVQPQRRTSLRKCAEPRCHEKRPDDNKVRKKQIGDGVILMRQRGSGIPQAVVERQSLARLLGVPRIELLRADQLAV
jgi:hypothetical protein